MGEKTVLFYGTPEHPTLEALYQHLRERGRRRTVFVVQEQFPREVGIVLGAGRNDAAGLLLPPHEEPIELDDVCGVVLDGYYVDASTLQDLDPNDIEYVQTEGWATLIALFGRLARRPDCVVANHVTRRERVGSRAAALSWLASCGLPVPRVLVTSDPEAARRFCEALGDRAIYKPASTPTPQFKPFEPADVSRLDAVKLAPVHFEEAPVGDLVQCVVVGRSAFALRPDGEALIPDDISALCVDACARLDLRLGEISLRAVDGRFVATSLRTHLAPDSLQDPGVLEAAASLLEGA